MSRWRLFYHVVWGTKNREPVISEAAADLVRRAIQRTCTELGVIVHAIGVMPEHVHLAVSVPPRIAIADFVRDVKGSTSHLVNRSIQQPVGDWFFWQPEYGVLSFDESSLDPVKHYIDNQWAHHTTDKLWPGYETWSDYQPKAVLRSLEEAL